MQTEYGHGRGTYPGHLDPIYKTHQCHTTLCMIFSTLPATHFGFVINGWRDIVGADFLSQLSLYDEKSGDRHSTIIPFHISIFSVSKCTRNFPL